MNHVSHRTPVRNAVRHVAGRIARGTRIVAENTALEIKGFAQGGIRGAIKATEGRPKPLKQPFSRY